MKEILDIVDRYGEPTGETVERSIAHLEGIPHRTSHLWIVRERNGRPEVLLQKRALTKSFPGCYDISSAGHIPAGDGYRGSAIRELREELGFTAAEDDLVCCGDRRIVWDDVFFGEPYHDRQYTRVFLIWLDPEEDALTLQEEEVDSVRWMDLEECIEGVEQGRFRNCIEPEELKMVLRAAKRSGGTVRLETDRLVLRRHVPEDAQVMFELFGSDERMCEFTGWNPYATALQAQETVQRFIASYEEAYFFGWTVEKDGQFIGTVGAYDYDPDENSIEAGISIARDHWGQGFASEALAGVLRYLTEERGISVVKAWCADRNIGSKRVMENCGMLQVGRAQDAIESGGRTYDRLDYEYRKA
ncbi:MAG: GNAT family N-acetyltransferase [Mogibacterium sp.]|nr:GNAT family N-acetyltransferase [Mogibacterium sp.]